LAPTISPTLTRFVAIVQAVIVAQPSWIGWYGWPTIA
jgi:hypothetical protein